MERIVQKIVFDKSKVSQLKRVAAYARVSCEKDAMLHSLSAQVSYYNDMIQRHDDWLFCGVYADEALTGTKESRKNFQKLLTECRAGHIDLIITKSISRFARNTVTLLETVRELKTLAVDVFFEEQNIHSISADGELMLTILASYAQEESLSASENQKWRIRRDFENGRIGSIHILGYSRNANGQLEIIPEEAEIVRLIFSSYISGMGKQSIANMLNEKNIKAKNGGKWTCERVSKILINEKYAGDMLLQKTYRENHLTKKQIKNTGQLPQYFVDDAHPAIIERQLFDAVQVRLKNQKEQFGTTKLSDIPYSFTGIIRCECCGKNYRRKNIKSGTVWICSTFNTKGKKYCPTAKQIPENTLKSVCCDVLEIEEFDEIIFRSSIEKIIVPAPNKLIFIFYDGRKVKRTWKDRSRAESWTPEMKEKARIAACRK